jgi:hypothetical protein
MMSIGVATKGLWEFSSVAWLISDPEKECARLDRNTRTASDEAIGTEMFSALSFSFKASAA